MKRRMFIEKLGLSTVAASSAVTLAAKSVHDKANRAADNAKNELGKLSKRINTLEKKQKIALRFGLVFVTLSTGIDAAILF